MHKVNHQRRLKERLVGNKREVTGVIINKEVPRGAGSVGVSAGEHIRDLIENLLFILLYLLYFLYFLSFLEV